MAHDKSDFLKPEFFTAAVVVCLGIFFMFHAYSIETFQKVLIGPRPVPMAISAMIIGFGILQFFVAWVGHGESGNSRDAESPVMPRAAAFRMTAVILIGFAYIWLFSATGYLIATAMTMAPLLVVFGTYDKRTVAVLTIAGTAAYYTIFIWLMGIYDPAGWLINFETIGLS